MKWIRRVCVDIHLRGRRNGRPSWFRSLALLSLWGDYRRAAKLAEACLELSLKSWSTRTIFVGFILQYSDGIGAAKGSRSIQSFSIDVEKINGIRLWCIDFRSVPPPPQKKKEPFDAVVDGRNWEKLINSRAVASHIMRPFLSIWIFTFIEDY